MSDDVSELRARASTHAALRESRGSRDDVEAFADWLDATKRERVAIRRGTVQVLAIGVGIGAAIMTLVVVAVWLAVR